MIPPAPLSESDRAELLRLRSCAEAQPFDIGRVESVAGYRACEDAVDLGHPLAATRIGLLATTQAGFVLAFTIEQYPQGWARHLSFAAPRPGGLPPSRGIIAIGRELGMRLDIFDPDCWSSFHADRPEKSTTLDILELMTSDEVPS